MVRQRYFGDRLDELPLILAGPMLRHVSDASVTVWFALTHAATIRLTVIETEAGQGQQLQDLQMEGKGYTIRLGRALHLCAVTATGQSLEPSTIYAYDVEITTDDAQIQSLAALSPEVYGPEGLSYFSHGLPTFATTPSQIDHLKLMHGSCRKPHGNGDDLLAILDQSLAATASSPQNRVQQLYFTGDQIYGDDVADPLLWVATDVGDMLLGWEESLPIDADEQKQSYALVPGIRSTIAKEKAGLTSTLGNSDEVASSHFFSLGEYSVAYLLVWSPFLWPKSFPTGAEVQDNIASSRQWDADVQRLNSFITSLPCVRRALANVSTYMICDDHDVSDDWYLNRDWCERVLGKPLGYRVVFNGLLTYALFQAWGNDPSQFFPDSAGASLCHSVEQWSRSGGTDSISEQAIAAHLGLPADPQSLFCRDESVDILQRDTAALRWHYHVRSPCHEVIVLDTRTWRGYPDGSAIAPPMLLSPTAFQNQLTDALRRSPDVEHRLTFIVLPTNLVCVSLVEQLQRWDFKQNKVFRYDVGDSWNFHKSAFTQLLLTISEHRQRVIILTGDIHYSSAVMLQVWNSLKPQDFPSTVVQLTCSAIKNAETSTYLAHTKLKALIPEPDQDWLGWNKSPQIDSLIYAGGRAYRQQRRDLGESPYWYPTRSFVAGQGNAYLFWTSQPTLKNSPPDWRYCLTWIPRQAVQPTTFSAASSATRSGQSEGSNRLSWLWKNSWIQDGPTVVGHNNIGVISIGHHGESRVPCVIQDCYWVAPWTKKQVVKSRYIVPLEHYRR